jgi:CheY-like chemotaxis protein
MMAGKGIGFGLTTADGRQPRVAIVDANTSSATIVTALVRQFGCSCEVAASGDAVLRLLRRDEPVDVVLMDLSIPDMDGTVAAQLIRALGVRGTMPIVALTGNRADIANPRSHAANFVGAVVKPYSPRDLHAALQAALARQPAPVAIHA